MTTDHDEDGATEYPEDHPAAQYANYDADLNARLLVLAAEHASDEWWQLPASKTDSGFVYGLTDLSTDLSNRENMVGDERRLQVTHAPDARAPGDDEWKVTLFEGRRVGQRYDKTDTLVERIVTDRDTALDTVENVLSQEADRNE